MKASVVFSFYNEEKNLEELISRVRKVFNQTLGYGSQDYELIFVNDKSTDRSVEILIREYEKIPDIRIISMSRNFGVTPCLMAGLQHSSGDYVVFMDADLQDPPELIADMVRIYEEKKVDVVHTRRTRREGETWLKLFVTHIGYKIINRLSTVDIDYNVGDFKLLSRRAVNHLTSMKEHRPFTRGLVKWIGFTQIFIEYKRHARFSGKTNFPVYGWRVINNFLDSALIAFSEAPLKLALILGFLVSSGAFLYLIIIFIMKIVGWALPGWAAIMATMLVLGGMQLLTIGVLGLYLNAVFIESKGRPHFIIENKYGFKED